MDAIAVIRALLLDCAPVTRLLGDRVFAGDVPMNAELPAIGLSEISRTEPDTVARDEVTTLVTTRVQVTVHAKDYPQQKALLLATKLGPGTYTGTIAGVVVKSVLRDTVGPDMSDAAAGVFQQSRDFKVTYLEQNPV